MAKGRVKWFNAAKGYGFIVPDENRPEDRSDVFVHYSEIKMDGYKALKADDRVVYDLKSGPRGVYAADVLVEGW